MGIVCNFDWLLVLTKKIITIWKDKVCAIRIQPKALFVIAIPMSLRKDILLLINIDKFLINIHDSNVCIDI